RRPASGAPGPRRSPAWSGPPGPCARRPAARSARSLDALSAVVVGEPAGVAAKLDAAVGVQARGGAARGQAELVDADRQAARVGEGNLDVGGDYQRGPGEPHRADADVVAERRQLFLEPG